MFEHRLLETRKKKGLTQAQLAEKAGIHVASYSAYENNRKMPPVDILIRIANVLDVSLDWLCGNEKEMPTVNSYGDIARTLVSVLQKMGKKCKIDAATDLYDGASYAQILLFDDVLFSFFEKAHKFDEMLNGNADERELYFAWLEKKLAELDKKPLYHQLSDDELPF